MEERKIVLDQAIPENYSMLKVTVFNYRFKNYIILK